MTLEAHWTAPAVPEPRARRKGRRDRFLRDLLASLNVCSKEFKSRQYDGEVKGLSVIKPYVGVFCDMPSDATIMRVEYFGESAIRNPHSAFPIPHSHEGVILARGINPFYSDLDTYWMMASIIDEAVRRIISAGGTMDHIAGLDNFCWPDPVFSEKTPDGKYKLAQLVRANKALYDVTTAYGVPCISGKDSMKNDSTRGGVKISIPPTVLFSTIARMPDVRRAVTMDMKRAGDMIYVIGLTRDEMGASAFYRLLALPDGVSSTSDSRQGAPARIGGTVPHVDCTPALSLYRAMGRATERGLLRSCHTPTRGGLAVAFALSAMGGNLGAEIGIHQVPADRALTEDELLFSESNSRFLVTVSRENAAELESLFVDLPCARVGQVTDDAILRVRGPRDRTIIESDISRLRKAFKKTLHGI